MTQRTDRIDQLFRQEISDLLAREIADPRIGFVTVTDVETTTDLRHARVWVSVIGQPEDRQAAVHALEGAMPFIRHELGKRLRLRRIPEFSVRLDESIERGSRVMQLISELEAGETPTERPEGESLPTPTARSRAEAPMPEGPDMPVGTPPRSGRRPATRPPGARREGGRPATSAGPRSGKPRPKP